MDQTNEKYLRWLNINCFRDCLASRIEFNRIHREKVPVND